jgi:hypothetical protein
MKPRLFKTRADFGAFVAAAGRGVHAVDEALAAKAC